MTNSVSNICRFTNEEALGINQYTCSICGRPQIATKQLSLKLIPPILCFQFKRFEHTSSASKVNTMVFFPPTLDMSHFTTAWHERENSSMEHNDSEFADVCRYNLFAVINHHGGMETGHYTNYSKSNGQWFKFDDHTVTLSSEADVLDSKA